MMHIYIITKQRFEHKAFARTKVPSLVGYSRVSNAVRVNSQDELKLLNSFTTASNAFYNLVHRSHYLRESKVKLSDIRSLSE